MWDSNYIFTSSLSVYLKINFSAKELSGNNIKKVSFALVEDFPKRLTVFLQNSLIMSALITRIVSFNIKTINNLKW